MIRREAVVLLALLPALAAAPRAHAQGAASSSGATAPSSENRALAETLFFAGRGLMEAKRYKEACVKLAESYRLDAAAGTLLNLAVCHEQEGKIASAWGEYRQALSDARRAGRPDREELANEHVKALEPELPILTINVAPAARVPGLEVLRNGVPLSSAAWATELPVDPGQVEIVARAPGFKPRTTTLTIEKKQRAATAVEPLEPAPVELSQAPRDEFWTGRRTVGALVAGIGLAAVGVGAGFGVNALGQRSKSDDACPLFDNERRCSAAGSDAMSQARTSAWVSDISIGVGAVSIAAGAYLFFTGGKKAVEAPPPAAWNVRINMGAGGGMGVVTRSF